MDTGLKSMLSSIDTSAKYIVFYRIKFSTNLLSPGWLPLMSGITSVAPRLLATITASAI